MSEKNIEMQLSTPEIVDLYKILDGVYKYLDGMIVSEKFDYICIATIYSLEQHLPYVGPPPQIIDRNNLMEYLHAYEKNYKRNHSIDIWDPTPDSQYARDRLAVERDSDSDASRSRWG